MTDPEYIMNSCTSTIREEKPPSKNMGKFFNSHFTKKKKKSQRAEYLIKHT